MWIIQMVIMSILIFANTYASDLFKACCSVAPHCWSYEKYWYEDTNDAPQDVFLCCLENFNGKQQRLIKTCLMMVDE